MGNSINEGNGNIIRGKNSKMKQNNFMKTHSGFGISNNNNFLIGHNHNNIVSMNMSISNNNKNIAMTSKQIHSPIILAKQRIITAK